MEGLLQGENEQEEAGIGAAAHDGGCRDGFGQEEEYEAQEDYQEKDDGSLEAEDKSREAKDSEGAKPFSRVSLIVFRVRVGGGSSFKTGQYKDAICAGDNYETQS